MRSVARFWPATVVLACASSAPPAPTPAPRVREACGVGGLGLIVPAPGGDPDVTEGGRKASEGLPGAAPQLDKVTWHASETEIMGSAHFTASHRPVKLVAFAPQAEYRFQLTSCIEKETSVSFIIQCRKDRGPHIVVYRLRVEDKLRRESNVVEKQMECPGGRG